MLTRRLARVLQFIDETAKANGGVPPSYAEICTHFRWSSKQGAHRAVVALERRGFIRRIPGHARAIEVVRLSEPAGHLVDKASGRRAPVTPDRCVPVPVMGKID